MTSGMRAAWPERCFRTTCTGRCSCPTRCPCAPRRSRRTGCRASKRARWSAATRRPSSRTAPTCAHSARRRLSSAHLTRLRSTRLTSRRPNGGPEGWGLPPTTRWSSPGCWSTARTTACTTSSCPSATRPRTSCCQGFTRETLGRRSVTTRWTTATPPSTTYASHAPTCRAGTPRLRVRASWSARPAPTRALHTLRCSVSGRCW
mmetsp:Transcript_54625/g.130916  ORF Transcript_54625/g.130916 Transcript_54625/m.130916 type:complete len:204 (-) Transcript_54625:743-1354(-)